MFPFVNGAQRSTHAPSSAIPYLALGATFGVAYAVLNTAMDYWDHRGAVAGAFVAVHGVVDKGIPVLAGLLAGLAFHDVRMRTAFARAERERAELLRGRLQHVERDQAVWVVAASALHEIKNPLHTAGLLLEELEEGPSAEERARIVASMRAELDRAAHSLSALRKLAASSRRDGPAAKVSDVARAVVADLTPLASEAGTALTLDARAEGDALADGGYLRIILENLVANSIEELPKTGRGGHVHVELREAESGVELTVFDDGPGIPEGERERIFEPLRSTKADGLGLGLAVSRALARARGGDVRYVADPRWSTGFRVTLPAPQR